METIKEFLESDIYLDIIKKLGVDNFNDELLNIEIERLINRLKQRQFLLEGFNCKLYSEILADYYKRLRIPGAMKYAREMKKLYKKVFD